MLPPSPHRPSSSLRTLIACQAAVWRAGRGLVPPRGFEPLISALKGPRPRPLDDGGTHRPIVGHGESASNQV